MKNVILFCALTLLWPVSQLHAQQEGVLATVDERPALPRVVLLGDSISIGYTQFVRGMLRGQANVQRAPTNCGPTSKGLEQLDQWLGDKQWDAIHFNFGLHDLKYIDATGKRVPPEAGSIQIEPAQYRQNLTTLLERLKATGAKLIWCTTTPVPQGAHGRIPGDAQKYNAIAAEVVQQVGDGQIAVNDLFGFANAKLDQIQRKADVHFYPEGSRQLGMEVTAKLRTILALPAPTPEFANGVVFEDLNGNGTYQRSDKLLPGVRVSNGQQIVSTDAKGHYSIPVDDDTILFVIKPRNYRTPVNKNQLPQFFYNHKPFGSPGSKYAGVMPTGSLPNSVDFPLYRQREPDQFKALMFGDPQPRNQKEVDYIAHDVIEELIGTDASFGVTLGDIVFDDLSLFESQARMIALLDIPWYNVIGNHDINLDAPHDELSDETFERAFGPAYYSFDYGSAHFLVIDNVEWYVPPAEGESPAKGTYRGGIGERQMEFIRKDLEAIPPNQLVVMMMHIPLTDVVDRQGLYRLIEQRPFCVSIAAHTHRHEHKLIGKEDGFMGAEPHHHIVNVTVSGSWWGGAKDERSVPHSMMADGAPNGYSMLVFDGNQYTMDYKVAGRSKDYQMSVFAPEVVKANGKDRASVFVNYFNGSPKSRLELKVGEHGAWRQMEKTAEEDPYFRRIYQAEAAILAKFADDGEQRPFTPLTGGRPSSHLWRIKLPKKISAGTHLIHARATDRHGRVYHGKRVLRVE